MPLDERIVVLLNNLKSIDSDKTVKNEQDDLIEIR